MEYFTKWFEAIPLKKINDKEVMDFLVENIFSHFGFPRKLIIDNAKPFFSTTFHNCCDNYEFGLGHSIAYYPQGNGLVESTNKNIMKILKKIFKL